MDPFAFEKARPALDLLGTETIHLGPSGSGAMPKQIDKFLCGAQVAALAEAIAAIKRSGLAAFRD